MCFDGADLWQVLPAAGALLVLGFFHGGAEGLTALDVQLTEDEELVQGGGVVPDGVGEAFLRQGDHDAPQVLKNSCFIR